MELRHLRYFIALAEELHFGRAAKRLHVAQPPLSRQIQDLEAYLRVRLFNRNRRKVELTEAGQTFLDRARLVIADVDRAVSEARRADRGEFGQLEIGHSPSADLSILPTLISAVREQLPDVSLVLRHLSGPTLHEALRMSRIRVALLRLPFASNEFEVIPMLAEHLVAALPATHHLANIPQISIKDLAREPIVLFPPAMSPLYFQMIAEFCAREGGFGLHVAQESDTIQTTLGLVAAGFGVSLQPESIRNLARSGVVVRPILESPACVVTGLAYRKDDKSELLRRFLEIAQACVERKVFEADRGRS